MQESLQQQQQQEERRQSGQQAGRVAREVRHADGKLERFYVR